MEWRYIILTIITDRSYEFHLMQLADSFFPSGTFGMSNGLESFVKKNMIRNQKDVSRFIELQMHFQFGPCDCMVMSLAMEAAYSHDLQSAIKLDNAYYSMKLVRDVRTASIRSGRQILICVAQVMPGKKQKILKWNSPNIDTNAIKFVKQFLNKMKTGHALATYPVSLGIATACFGIPKESAIRMMLYTYSCSMIAAALRLGVIHHFDGQKILMQLGQTVNCLSSKLSSRRSINDIWQLSPLVDIFQMNYEHLDSKMFIT
jgi:urease accessory protein